jgi:hypothetical protein
MSERDRSHSGDAQSQADRTLLGVPAPRVESSAESPLRSPVFVRSGTSIADVEGPPPVPRMALPSRPRIATPETDEASKAPSAAAAKPTGLVWFGAVLKLPVLVSGTEAALWMVAGPVVLAAFALAVLLVTLLGSAGKPAPSVATVSNAAAPVVQAPATTATSEKPSSHALSKLEGRAPESLTSSELVQLAEGQAAARREAAKALRSKVEANPALAKDKAMTALEPPIGADLLYEVWTGTTARTDATELARALVYSKDMRLKASPALAVALDLRAAERCEQYQAALPKALKDGDRRALHLLTKLTSKRGCGPKKNEDCYACLRDQGDELTATINAVKSRRPPSYTVP